MRWRSVDVFRGLTVAAMVVVNNPGDWDTVYAPLLHAEWNGWTPTDLIFPFFLFIVGVSITLGRTAGGSWLSVWRRGAVIWGLGLFMAGYPFFRLATWRIPGVLARIAWSFVGTVLLVRLAERSGRARRTPSVAAIVALLLGVYWVLIKGDMSPAGNLGAWLDRALMQGHLWKPDWDPEGVLSTVPAIGTTLLGVLAGWTLQESQSPRTLVRTLLLWGLAGVIAGLVWSAWFPINKSLWTSSYVLFTGGLASVALAVCYWLFDVAPTRMMRRLSEPAVALGRNAILLFVVSGLFAKTLIYLKWPDPAMSLARWIYLSVFVPVASPYNASLLYALANLALLYGLLAVLHRRKLYLSV
ncbi:MAG: heparan-alpha-glucosaminide N-acetyltransferase domain-containing protein [Vicinamibacterales bacterium]